jgi:flagellar protein FlaF
MSHQAYQQAALRADSARGAEYRLFGQVTLALMAAAKGEPSDPESRAETLEWNCRLWSVLAGDCVDPKNALPESLRATIISLSLWVERHTRAVAEGRETIEPLVEVNRMVMQGLGDGAAA